MALLIILYLTHWAAWEYLPWILEHKYFLPTGGNLFVLCRSTYSIGSVAFNGVKWVVLGVDWTQKFLCCGVTHEWMSYVFEKGSSFDC